MPCWILEAIIKTHVGINIKQLRRLHNLNQTEFAKKIGISQGSLSDLEAGNSKPAIETVISICTIFGCSYEWLLTGNEYSIDGELNSTITELVQTVSRLNLAISLGF
ncbi:helix-turn-helix domain-containing protein [Paenibacillus camerounensis]|uniref:helix-turn-helix domain-containing protein n=1 Tax=Paenibacillus camerounensis TaxID=1243663 RepID=UPI0006947BAC|nr:helix-turn-helix transcriptional regulator [Paenibacillus camerounensis]